MDTRKPKRNKEPQTTIGIRIRIDRELHARIIALTERFPVNVDINDQARRCLEVGVEAEEQGGLEPMIDSKIKQQVEESVAAALAKLADQERKLDEQQRKLDELMAFLKGPPGKDTKLSKKAHGGGEVRVA